MGTTESLLGAIAPYFPVLLFGPGVALFVFFVVYNIRRKRAREALRLQYPSTPWKWKADWAAGRIRYRPTGRALAMSIFAFFWNIITFPIAIFAWLGKTEKAGCGIVILTLLPLMGLFAIRLAVLEILRWRKYGESIFELAEVPGVIGGSISGIVETSVPISPEDGYHLSLQCMRRVVSGHGKNSHTLETVLWEVKQTVNSGIETPKPGQTIIPVVFPIPDGVAESDDSNSRNIVFWLLKVTAATPGVDYEAIFEVPVFRASARPPNQAPD